LPDDAAGLFSKSVYAERIEKDVDKAIDLVSRAFLEAKPNSNLKIKAFLREERLRKRLQPSCSAI